MKRIFVLAVALAFIFSATISMAYSLTDHVKEAPNGKGDLFFTPYLALEGLQTKLTVTNTDKEYSSVVKVIIHSKEFSTELLDFFLYLSPADVWTGYLVYEDGQVKVKSEDDSILVDTAPTFASENNPVSKAVFTDDLCSGDTAQIGYVEAVQATSFTIAGETRPIEKEKVFNEYEDASGLIGHPRNILTASSEFQYPAVAGVTQQNSFMFADWDNNGKLGRGDISGIKGNSADNTIGELEAAMAKKSIAMNYGSDDMTTVHMMTFPTKMSEVDSDCNYVGPGAIGGIIPSPFWETTNSNSQCLPYGSNAFNLHEEMKHEDPDDPFSGGEEEEGNKMCNEVELIAGFPFDEGWVEYTFNPVSGNQSTDFTTQDGTPLQYTGVPVLPQVVNLSSDGFSAAKAAYDDGTVGDSTGVYPGYKYTDY